MLLERTHENRLLKSVPNAPASQLKEASAHLAHLSLGEAQRCRQLGSLWQCQILGLLEAPLKGRQLETGVDGAWFPDFLWLPVHYPDFRLKVFLVCNAKRL